MLGRAGCQAGSVLDGRGKESDCQFVDVRATVCWEQFVDLVDRSSREFCWGEISRLLSVFAMGFGSHVALDAVRGHYAGLRLLWLLLKYRGCGCGCWLSISCCCS